MPSDEKLLEHVKGALLACYKAVIGKGAEGKTEVETEIDMKTVGDLAASEALVGYFNSSGLPVVLYTEELEKPMLLSGSPVYSVIGDEIDGTYNFHRGMGMLPHGSIVGVSASKNPKLNEFVCSGFLEFNSGNLFYAVKGKGGYVIEKWAKGGKSVAKLVTSGKKSVEDLNKVMFDFYMLSDLSKPLIEFGKEKGDVGSFAGHVALLANGTVDLFISGDNCKNPNKLKTGEEIGPLYLLVKESGGAVLDWRGNDLGPEEVGLDRKKVFHLIVAASEELGKKVASKMSEIPEIDAYMAAKGL
ncbi:hypothetical protein J4470_01905 [Candidatus Woesearchaeota archaeon]|nr:hypothetical protein [Candidatus Woesearchaeota archaeon]